MWFKNITVHPFAQPVAYEPERLEDMLQQHPSKPATASAPNSIGFIPPIGDTNSPMVYGSEGFMLFCMQLSTKILPPAVLREQHLIKIKELEDKLGTRIARNERLTIKEELEYTLLGKAFTQSSRIYAYINCKTGRLIIDTTSKKKLDMAYKLLHPVLSLYEPSSFELEPLGSKLTQWLSQQDHPDCFSILDKCLMTSSEEKVGKLSFSNIDLFDTNIQNLLQGKQLTQLRLNWDNKIDFTLKEDMSINSLRFLEDIKDLAKDYQAESEAERFAGDFFIMAQTLTEFLKALLPELIETKPA